MQNPDGDLLLSTPPAWKSNLDSTGNQSQGVIGSGCEAAG